MDKDFETRERRMLLDAARAKDKRANKLMDSFDDASMQGLGANQGLLDNISTKIKALDSNFAQSLDGAAAQNALKLLQGAIDFSNFLGADSEMILKSFGVADRMLNDADYEVSVCEAKVVNSSPAIFRQLEDAKKKEDKKIEEDLQARIASMRGGQQEIVTSIQTALNTIPKGDVKAASPPVPAALPVVAELPTSPVSVSAEEQQQERLRKALEAAKKRNATRPPALP
jgi:hypothetical protein